MFEKLFNLVKVNAGTAIMENPAIAENLREAALNDASSSIIEVLKKQVETGRLKDLVKYFQFAGIYENPLINAATNKFANKLNNYYGLDPKTALLTSQQLIPQVMQELIRETKSAQNKDFALSTLLSKVSGGAISTNMLAMA